MGANDDSSELLEDQIAKQNAEIQEKTETMAEERLNLIKSQGAPSWDAARARPVSKMGGSIAEREGRGWWRVGKSMGGI